MTHVNEIQWNGQSVSELSRVARLSDVQKEGHRCPDPVWREELRRRASDATKALGIL